MANEDLYESADYINSYHKTPGKRIENILKNIEVKETDRIVDYACGSGLLAVALDGYYKEYIGVDTSSLFIENATKFIKENELKNTSFVNKEITSFANNHKNCFTKAFTLDFSEHIDDDNFVKIYTAIKETLKENSLLIVHTPNKDFILEKVKDLGILPQTSGHIGVRNFREYKVLLERCGYKNIEVKYLKHYRGIINILPTSSKARLLITCTS